MSHHEFTVEYLDPRDLHPHPANPARHPETQRVALGQSVAEHGWLAAPIVNKRGGQWRILDGHARVELAVESEERLIPVRVVDVDEAQEKRILAVFNRIGDLREQDDAQLAALLQELSASEAGLPAGWGEADLAALLAELEPESGLQPGVDPDALPEHVETRCKVGELWQLGDHRLLCGDCTLPADVARALGEARPVVCITDPPYGFGKDIENDSGPEVKAVHEGFLAAMPLDVGILLAFHGTRTFPLLLDLARGDGWKFERMLWLYKKNQLNGWPWHGWMLKSEVLLVFTRAWARWPKEAATNVHDCYEAIYGRHDEQWEAGSDGRFSHPTAKQYAVIEDVVKHTEGDIYEPFAGSGTTLIAATALARRCVALELEPRYCDVILTRWEAATGRAAVRLD